MRNDVDKEITSKQINQFEVKPIVPHNLQKCTFMCIYCCTTCADVLGERKYCTRRELLQDM